MYRAPQVLQVAQVLRVLQVLLLCELPRAQVAAIATAKREPLRGLWRLAREAYFEGTTELEIKAYVDAFSPTLTCTRVLAVLAMPIEPLEALLRMKRKTLEMEPGELALGAHVPAFGARLRGVFRFPSLRPGVRCPLGGVPVGARRGGMYDCRR